MLTDRPMLKMGLRMLAIGVAAAMASLKASLDDGVSTEEWYGVVEAGYIAALTYAGLGMFTPLEPTVGARTKPK